MKIGSCGALESRLKKPFGVMLIEDVLYVTDNESSCVKMFTVTGEYLGQFGNSESNPGLEQLCSPTGICSDGRGHILVADFGNRRVQIFSADGAYVDSFQCAGKPLSVAVDNTGKVYVVSNALNCVQVFSSDGRLLSLFTGNSTLRSPTALAIDENGYLLVSESDNSRICIFDHNENLVTSVSTHAPNGISLDVHGDIYVATPGNYCVKKY